MRFTALICFLLFTLAMQVRAGSVSPLKFVRNNNQWEKGILYRADVPGGFLFIRKQALQYVFYDTKALQAHHIAQHEESNTSRTAFTSPDHHPNDLIRAHGFQIDFIGSNPASTLEALHENLEKRNYFMGKDPSHWATNVSSYGEIIYRNIYPGIDLRLYVKNEALKYEFIVAPKADASRIKLRYSGASEVKLHDEQLLIRTSVNSITETKPYCYQTTSKGTQEIKSGFNLKGNDLTFDFPQSYEQQEQLVIDPVLVFSTFSGAASDNWGHCATFDEEDNMYATGTAWGTNFPATNGAFSTSFSGGIDVAVLKYNPTGTQLLYASFLGGENTDVPHSTIVNHRGELVILGTTSSQQFPVSATAFDKTFTGGQRENTGSILYSNGSDLFIACISTNGDALIASTYFGGTANDGLRPSRSFEIHNYGDNFRGEVVTDEQDNIYISTVTKSLDFPLLNASQTDLQGSCDAVFARFNPDLSVIQWSTLFGGTGLDAASTMRVGAKGHVYIAGVTTSTSLPGIKSGALNATFGGIEDGFVVHYQNDQLTQATYIGTPQADQVFLMDLDKNDNVYLFGLTSGNYPITAGRYNVPGGRQFIHALQPDLSKTIFSTAIGSANRQFNITPTAFMVNECEKIYLSGWGGIVNASTTNTINNTVGLPTTPDALKTKTDGDDFYIMMLETGATSLLYATFFGNDDDDSQGDHVDGGTSRFNKKGVIYQATCACKGSGFPTTPGAWSTVNGNDNCNNIAFKIDIDFLRASFDVYDANGTKDVIAGCKPFTARFVNTSVGGKRYEWDLGGLATSTTAGEVSYTFTQPGTYTIQLNAINNLTCKREDSATRTITVFPENYKISKDTIICIHESVQLQASGAKTYLWSPAEGLSDPTIANPIAAPTTSTRYTVNMINEFGCSEEKSVMVSISSEIFNVDFELDSIVCAPFTTRLVNKSVGGIQFEWHLGDLTTVDSVGGVTYTFTQPGKYVIWLKAYDACGLTDSLSKTIQVFAPNFSANGDATICRGEKSLLSATGGTSYLWSPSTGLDDPTSATPNASPSATTTYSVKITNKETTCSSVEQVTITVVKEAPPAVFDFTISSECDKMATVRFLNNSEKAEYFQWILGNGDTLNTADPEEYTYAIPGTYQVVLKTFQGICQQSTSKMIDIEANIEPTNVITPNGDGLNEKFVISAKGTLIALNGYKLEIYNRWGKMLYQSDSYQHDWGAGITNGVYYYLLTSPKGLTCKGWVQVLY